MKFVSRPHLQPFQKRDTADLHTFDIDAGADEFLPNQRGFGVSAGDRVEDISFHVHLLTQLHCRTQRTHMHIRGQLFMQTVSPETKDITRYKKAWVDSETGETYA